jgi:hypothetical protein
VILIRYSCLLELWVRRELQEPEGSSLRKSSPFATGILFSRSRARNPGLAFTGTAFVNVNSNVAVAREYNMIKNE